MDWTGPRSERNCAGKRGLGKVRCGVVRQNWVAADLTGKRGLGKDGNGMDRQERSKK